MKRLIFTLAFCGIFLVPQISRAWDCMVTPGASGGASGGAATSVLADIGTGAMITGCCMATEPFASQMGLQTATQQEIEMMEFWRKSNEKAILQAGKAISIQTDNAASSNNAAMSYNNSNQLLGESLMKTAEEMSGAVAEIDTSCIPSLNYTWVKTRDAANGAASTASQYQRNILSGLNINAKEVLAIQAERAEVAKKQAVPFADSTLTPAQAEGVQAYIDLFYTGNIPDPDPSGDSQDVNNFLKEKQKYIFTQLMAADAMNRWLANRTGVAPAKEVNQNLAFHNLEAPTMRDYKIGANGEISDPKSTLPKAVSATDKISLQAVEDAVAKVALSDQFTKESLNAARQLMNVLKVESANLNMLLEIKNNLESSNVLLSLMVGLLNERQFAKLSHDVR